MKTTKDYRIRAIVFNPLVLIIYGMTCYYLSSLLQYGGVKRRLPVTVMGTMILLVWFLWCFYKKRKQRKSFNEKDHLSQEKMGISKIWYFTALSILLFTTIVTGMKIYQSGINYQGKLAWWIEDIKNKREVELTHNNIYEDGLKGVFEDIQETITLPDDLYISNKFELRFNKEGEILSIYTFLYGKDEKGETQSYLISYDRNKGEDVIISLNGHVQADFNTEMKLEPLMDLMQWIPLEEAVHEWNEQGYGILYYGVRSWGYNDQGIIYIDENGQRKDLGISQEEIIGYTVSVYVPGKEETIHPLRYIHNQLTVLPKEEEELHLPWDSGYHYNDGEETYFLNEDLGYQLSIVDAALGSRFYSLLHTQDSGSNWETINEDPFIGDTGVSSGITFINEKLGFIGLSHNGGAHADLYRTVDGGKTFEKVSIPKIEVSLNKSETYNAFDFPDMPYEKEGLLYLVVGQGADGDYKGGIKALYQSEDDGKTWTYKEEVKAP